MPPKKGGAVEIAALVCDQLAGGLLAVRMEMREIMSHPEGSRTRGRYGEAVYDRWHAAVSSRSKKVIIVEEKRGR